MSRERASLQCIAASQRRALVRPRRLPVATSVTLHAKVLAEAEAMHARCLFWEDVWGHGSDYQLQLVISRLRSEAQSQAPFSITWEQYKDVIDRLPSYKAPDEGCVTYEAIKLMPETFHLALWACFQQLLAELLLDDPSAPPPPACWCRTLVALLPKKEGTVDVSQWRHMILKVFSRLLLLFLQPSFCAMPCWIQGFRPGYSTSNGWKR